MTAPGRSTVPSSGRPSSVRGCRSQGRRQVCVTWSRLSECFRGGPGRFKRPGPLYGGAPPRGGVGSGRFCARERLRRSARFCARERLRRSARFSARERLHGAHGSARASGFDGARGSARASGFTERTVLRARAALTERAVLRTRAASRSARFCARERVPRSARFSARERVHGAHGHRGVSGFDGARTIGAPATQRLHWSACGEMAERLKAPVLKTGGRESVPWVRIPLSPP